MDERRRDPATRSKVTTLVDETIPQWTEEWDQWRETVEWRQRASLIALGAVVVVLFLGLLTVALTTRSLYERTSSEALGRAIGAERSTREVQRERRQALLLACRETNARNQQARAAVGRLPEDQQAVARLFADALAPYRQDCAEYADERVQVVP